MKRIITENAPSAVGPYSQAIESGGLIFISGQLGLDKNGKLGADITEQTDNALKNLSAVLKASGSDLRNVLKTTCFLTDIKNFPVFNEIYGGYLTERPARSLVEVSALPKGAMVEIEAIAKKVDG